MSTTVECQHLETERRTKAQGPVSGYQERCSTCGKVLGFGLRTELVGGAGGGPG